MSAQVFERRTFTIDSAEIRARLDRDRVQSWGAAVAAEMAARRHGLDIRSRVTELLAGRGIGGTV